jgi:Fe-S cluster biogenesis protein NfuA
MVTREGIEAVLARVRPLLEADGLGIELAALEGNRATVRLTGACGACPNAQMTMYVGLDRALRDAMPEFEALLLQEMT